MVTNQKIFTLLILGSLVWVGARSSTSDSSIYVQTLKTHSRLVVRVDETVTSDWKNEKDRFELLLKGISYGDLGAPLGEEEQWRAQFREIRDPRMESLEVQEVPGGVKVFGKWKFPEGALALARPQMEAFDYREKTPAQVVIDFWVKKSPTRAEVQASRQQAARLATLKKAEEEARGRASRRLASEKIKADRENMTKFCRQPLNESNDILLPFLPVHEKVNFGKWFSVTTPDSEFPYFEPQTKARDAQYVRVALQLYREGKSALVIRTLEFFENEHPDSNFRFEMRFLKANSLIKLGHHKEAEQILARLMVDAKSSPVALYAGMFMAAKLFNDGSYLASLENFLWLISQYPDHRLTWVFHLGAAESLYSLKQTDRAAKEYQWIVENSEDPVASAQASMRIGDLYSNRLHFEQALASYFMALKHFGSQAIQFPSLYINRAEALYELGQYDRAKEAFEEFLGKNSGNPAGWRATFRLGEILARKEETVEEARKWFYSTINGYPFSPGATLARLRLIPCGDHAGFDAAGQDRFFASEATQFTGSGEVAMERYPDFRALIQVRALMSSGREEAALTLALQELKNQKRAEASRVLNTTVNVLFRKYLLNLLAEGKKYEAIKFYSDHSKSLPKSDEANEPDYLLKLSQAASDIGLGKMGQELADVYTRAMSATKGRNVAANPDPTDIDEKLRLSEQGFSKAKGLWVASGAAAEAEIRKALESVQEESPYSYGREVILALLDDKAGRHTGALNHVLRAQLLLPKTKDDIGEFRIACWLASLEMRVGSPDVALQMYRNLESHYTESKNGMDLAGILGVPPAPERHVLILHQAEILEKQSKWGEAASTYSRAAEKGLGGNQVLYGYARALLKSGDKSVRQKAFTALKKVSESKEDDFWKKLAREALARESAREGKK